MAYDVIVHSLGTMNRYTLRHKTDAIKVADLMYAAHESANVTVSIDMSGDNMDPTNMTYDVDPMRPIGSDDDVAREIQSRWILVADIDL